MHYEQIKLRIFDNRTLQKNEKNRENLIFTACAFQGAFRGHFFYYDKSRNNERYPIANFTFYLENFLPFGWDNFN